MGVDRVIIVSGDSHAEAPPDVWKDYLEAEFHEYLPTAYEDHEGYVAMLGTFSDFDADLLDVIDTDGVWRTGRRGAIGDLDERLRQMDREGTAAEIVYFGDPQAYHLFAPVFRHWDQSFYAAGSRVFDRWAADVFEPAFDRLYVVGDPGAGVDVDAMLTQLAWTADRGFRGAFLPGMLPRSDLPPLHDGSFDPYWAMLEDRGMWAVCHAGFGDEAFADKMQQATSNPENTSSVQILDQMNNRSEDFFHRAYEPLQAMWQMMLGGVFDRFPDLRFVLTEVRGDWIPGLLAHLDAAFDRARADLPAKRRPSEYWHSNCLQSLSFMHKCEVPLRHEIGIENFTFGRDYPHPEGTWPNTLEWLRDALVGVPEREVRMILGENAIRMLDLDRAGLERTAARVGFTVDDLTGPGPDIDPRKIESWDLRSGYLKPPEHVTPASIDALLAGDRRLAVALP